MFRRMAELQESDVSLRCLLYLVHHFGSRTGTGTQNLNPISTRAEFEDLANRMLDEAHAKYADADIIRRRSVRLVIKPSEQRAVEHRQNGELVYGV